jgi:hypothetical protein
VSILLRLTYCFSFPASPYPQELWLGGRHAADGTVLQSVDGLKAAMSHLGFELVKEDDMPLIIRQHARLYEFIGAKATIWRRK